MELSIPFVLVVGAVSSAVGVGITWGLLKGQVNAVEATQRAQSAHLDVVAAKLAAAAIEIAVVKSQHDRVREDLVSMEARITATITQLIGGLRNELNAHRSRE